MKKFLGTLAGLILLANTLVSAQTTTVTASSITDSDGTLWANGTVAVDFVPNPSYPNPTLYTLCSSGVPLNPAIVTQAPVTIGSGASFSVTAYDNTQVCPAGSQWKFTVCPNASAKCGAATTAVTGASQDITALVEANIQAPRFNAVAGTYGYADVEAQVQLKNGSNYWNVNSTCQRFYNLGSWTCSTTGGPYLPLSGGTLTGPITGTNATFSGTVAAGTASVAGTTTSQQVSAAHVASGDANLGSQMLANIYFSSGGGNWIAGTGWTLSGSLYGATASNATSALYEHLTLVAGTTYAVVYDLNSVSAGQVQVHFGGTTAAPAMGAIRTATGTYIDYLTADSLAVTNGNLVFDATGFSGSVIVATMYPIGASSQVSTLAAIGDSITFGYNGVSSPTPYTNYIGPLLESQTNDLPNMVNYGIPDQTCAQILANIGAYSGLLQAGSQQNIAVIWCGTNDLAGGASIQATQAYVAALGNNLRRQGWRVLVGTMLSRNGYDTQKAQLNAFIRKEWPNFSDGLVDVAANQYLGCDGCYSNGTYFYTDGVHPLPAAYQNIISPIIAGAVRGYMASKSPAPPNLGAEMLVNGDFNSATPWTAGSGWAISGGAANSTAATGVLYQNAGTLTAGTMYAVTYTISAYTSGNLQLGLGGSTNPSAAGRIRSTPGTFTDYLLADSTVNNNLVVTSGPFSSQAFTGSITNISMRPVSTYNGEMFLCATSTGVIYRAPFCNSYSSVDANGTVGPVKAIEVKNGYSGLSAIFWIDMPDDTHVRISNGASPGTGGVVTVDTNGNIGGSGYAQFGGSSISSGHTFIRHTTVSAALSPVAVAANTCAAQGLAVTGIQANDIVLNAADVKPTFQAGLSVGGVSVPSAGNVTINFCNNTASAITPTAGETYTFDVEQ